MSNRPRRDLVDGDALEAYCTGIRAAERMASLFPKFYKQHVAGRAICPALLCGVTDAFLQLVDTRLPSYECIAFSGLGRDTPPESVLNEYTDFSERDNLATLCEAAPFVYQPQPLLYGIGVRSIYEQDLDYSALTFALWHCFSDSIWSLGIDIAAQVRDDQHFELDWLVDPPELLAGMDPDAVVRELNHDRIGGVGRGTLVAYAFGRTANSMANWTDYEVGQMFNGETDNDWEDFDELVRIAAEARKIAEAYQKWSHQVEANPQREIPKLWELLELAAEEVYEPEEEEEDADAVYA